MSLAVEDDYCLLYGEVSFASLGLLRVEPDRFSSWTSPGMDDQSLCLVTSPSLPRPNKKTKRQLLSCETSSEDSSSTSSSGRKASGDDDKDFRRGGEEVGVRHESIEDLPEDVCFLYPAKKRRRRHLVSPFPRILKSDIRRIMSNMYANVLNSTDINLIASFYNQFCVSSCRSIDYANSPIIPQKVTVKRLDGVQSMVERLGQLLPQIPDFIFQLNRSYIQQELDKPGSTVVMEVQVKGTHLADPLVCIMDQHNESHTLPQSVLEEIQSSGRIANGHIRSYAYVNTPHELDVLAIISCSLDSNHRIYKMESNLEYRRPAASPALVIKQEPHGT